MCGTSTIYFHPSIKATNEEWRKQIVSRAKSRDGWD